MRSSGIPLTDRLVGEAQHLLQAGAAVYVSHRKLAMARSRGLPSLVHVLAEKYELLPTRVVTLLESGGFSRARALTWWRGLDRDARQDRCPIVAARGRPRATAEALERRRMLFKAVRSAYGSHHALKEQQ